MPSEQGDRAVRTREYSRSKKLRCEALNATKSSNKRYAAQLKHMPDQCTTNGEPHCGHVMCWTHRQKFDSGGTVHFVKSAAVLGLLFPNTEIKL